MEQRNNRLWLIGLFILILIFNGTPLISNEPTVIAGVTYTGIEGFIAGFLFIIIISPVPGWLFIFFLLKELNFQYKKRQPGYNSPDNSVHSDYEFKL